MRRADDLGRDVRRDLGDPARTSPDAVFLAALGSARRRQSSRRWVATAAMLVVTAVAATLVFQTPSDNPPTSIADPAPSVALEDHPMAAVLLEAARLRLDGFGDPAVAGRKLDEVVKLYPGTRSAAQAAGLLRALEGSRP
jgi:peptidoglycan/LPS O-acetylase OafA/YrhL